MLDCDIVVSKIEPSLRYYVDFGDARVVMVIVVGNGHGDSSSNPERD